MQAIEFDPGGYVSIPPSWIWTQPDGVPAGEPPGNGYTDTPFSHGESATAFISVVSGTLYIEELRLWNRFFSAALDMQWVNDCPSKNPLDPKCNLYPVSAQPVEVLRGARSNSVLLIPDVAQFNRNQIPPPVGPPSGSTDHEYASFTLQQSVYKSVMISGQPYNATWWVRSPGIYDAPPADGDDWNQLAARCLIQYTRPFGAGTTTDDFGGATAKCDPGNIGGECLERLKGCPMWIAAATQTGAATLYLNDPLNPALAPYTPYSYAFTPGSLLGVGDPMDARGCAIDPVAQMNADICKATPLGYWTFAIGCWGTSGDGNDTTTLCGGVKCQNSRLAGSVYLDGMTLSAARGAYVSPVFDSLSAQTVWEELAWDLELNEDGIGVRTPVGLSWRASNSTAVFGSGSTTFVGSFSPAVGLAGCELDTTTGPGPCSGVTVTTGRYFQWRGDLRNQALNPLNPPPLQVDARTAYPSCTRGYPAPYLDTIGYDGSLSPRVRQIAIRYAPFAGRFTSVPLAPPGLRNWKTITYDKDDGGGTVTCDIVDAAGNVILAGVASGALINTIDVGKYPAIAVRFTLDKGAVGSADPKVHRFKLTYESMKGCLAVDRNAVRLSRGEVAAIRFCTRTTGPVDLRIYDAAGQLVHRLFHGELRAGEVCQKYWWGTSDTANAATTCDLSDVSPRGPAVAPGLYIVTVTTPAGRETSRLAVSR